MVERESEHAPGILFAMTPDGNLIASAAVGETTPAAVGAAGRSARDLLGEDGAARLSALAREALAHGSAHGPLRANAADASVLAVNAPAGKAVLLVQVADGADDSLARAEAEARRLRAEMEEFVHVASHDLQEPVRMITSYLQLIERRYGATLDEDAREFMGYASDASTRLHEMLQGLLAYSRVTTRAAPFAPTAADAALDEALARLRPVIDASGTVVAREPLPLVLADADQLTTVFEHLVRNAIEFRRPGAPPRVRISAERAEGGWRIAVADAGIGIEPSQADRLFKPFTRLHPHHVHPGAGMGLAIVRKVVDRHGGSVSVEPAEGGGSDFRFTLPAADRERG